MRTLIAVVVFTVIIIASAPTSNYGNYIKSRGVAELVFFVMFLAGIPLIARFLMKHIVWSLRLRKYKHSNLAQIDKMSGEEFEEYLCFVFQNKGYMVKHVGKSHDFGADLILKRNGESIVVQAKRYNSNVGVKAVQEVIAARTYYDCDKCMVVTNSNFTKAAKELADKSGVTLWDRGYIRKNIRA